jgi:hypothetical protein
MNVRGEYKSRTIDRLRRVTFSSAWALLLLMPGAARSGGVVTNCTETTLRAAMAGGGSVTFVCDGTITLGSTITNVSDITLDGSGHQVSISGNSAVRVFLVNTNVRFAVVNLAITGGMSLGGSAILNLGGTVNLAGVTFSSNTATLFVFNDVLSPKASGGAIFNRGGTVNATNCLFAGNTALTPFPSGSEPPDTFVYGGAIRNEAGSVNLYSCRFTGNRASGASSAPGPGPITNGYPATGGAIHNSGTVTMDLCTFTGNSATGGDGGGMFYLHPGYWGGGGSGGGIFNDGSLTIDRSSFIANTAKGGLGGGGGSGDRTGTMNGFPGGGGGSACGGAIYSSASLWVARSTFASNVVTAGAGGYGGSGYFYIDVGGNGAPGANGGSALGGAVCGNGSLVNCTIAFNSGYAGAGGGGGSGAGFRQGGIGNGANGGNGGSGVGGVDGMCNLTNCTVAGNLGQAGPAGAGGSSMAGTPGLPGTSGSAYGGTRCGPMPNTLMAWNTPAGGDTFSDPKLGPLANNGGPTLTMALLPGSPAIDAGNTSLASATDQRGVPRPFGVAVDLGAFEFWPTLQVSLSGTNSIDILASGFRGQTCRLLASSNALNWVPMATNQIGPNGTALFHDTRPPGSTCRFYRLVMP